MISNRAVPVPCPSVPPPDTWILQDFGASLSERLIAPSNVPPTAATRNCISTWYESGAVSVIVLQPGTQRVRTTGSFSATQSASADASIVSLPLISSFMLSSLQFEQALCEAAIDRSALRVRE